MFKDKAAYDQETPFKELTFDKKSLANGTVIASTELEPCTYSATLSYDENENGKIDKNFLGMPKEGFNFSNFFMEKLSKPTFNDFKFEAGAASKIEIRVKYMKISNQTNIPVKHLINSRRMQTELRPLEQFF